ncbi:MAG: hypothetical protein P1U42_10980 [Phycisphaerales bacterium]|nr:hypothetical protein [Phycisphaerales bacterium]
MSDQSTHLELNNAEASRDALALLGKKLSKLCLKLKSIILLRGVFLSCAFIAGTILVMILVDYVLRLPIGIRVVFLLGLIYLSFRCWRSFVGPALRARVTPVDIAIQIEQRDPSLRGLVASAVELGDQRADTDTDPITGALRAAALTTMNRRLDGTHYPSIFKLKDLLRGTLFFVIVISLVGGMSYRTPRLAMIGSQRILTPWSGVSWPKRFAIVDVSDTSPRASDIAVPIRALIGSDISDDDANARATVNWRLTDRNRKAISEWTKTMLVPQNRRDAESGTPIYEQLLDIKGVTSRIDQESFLLEYKIQTQDDVKNSRMIELAQPPELVGTEIDIALPSYAQSIVDSGLILDGMQSSSTYDSVVSPVLEGSRVRIRWNFSKDVLFPENLTPAWVGSLASLNELESVSQPTDNSIELTLIATNSALIEPGVVDSFGIPVRTPIVLSMNVLRDQNPGVSIIAPIHDEIVSSHAMIDLQIELSDDLGLRNGMIESTVARKPGESSGAPHEAIHDPREVIRQDIDSEIRTELNTTLDLSAFEIQDGDQIWIVASAWDLRHDSEAEVAKEQLHSAHGYTESATRVLTIVSDAELIENVRKDLAPIRNSLRQLDGLQSDLQDRLESSELQSSREQRSIVSQLSNNKRVIDQLHSTIQRNALDDTTLESLLRDSSAVLDEAIKASEQASDRIDRNENEKAAKSQRDVRDRIGELLSMLDRGQDSWLALRAVQQLRDDLESIRDDTAELSTELAGKSLNQLDQNQRSSLEQILDRQLELSDDARQAVETLDERSEQLQEHDPTQAEALNRAAEQGRSSQIEQRLRDAGEQIASNQTSSATQTQSEVLDELEEMLEELENTIQNRDNALRRELASIIESIEGLISVQGFEIALLKSFIEDGPSEEHQSEEHLADRMIHLSQNTLSVRDEAIGAFPETRSIAEFIAKSAGSQSIAIESLRENPAQSEAAMRSEQTSLLNLNNALEEANRLDDQAADRQARRIRDELKDAYRESLEQQIVIRDETILLGLEALDRRGRATARTIASSQEQIRADLDELYEKTTELSDAPIFELAHTQLDLRMIKSREGLSKRTIERRVQLSQQASITILKTLVDVLDDQSSSDDSDDFDDGSQGGSSSGSGSQGEEPVIPPIAQIQLLRSMQELVGLQTRELSENPDLVNDEEIRAVSELQRQLFEHGQKLIEEMSSQTGAPVEDTPDNTKTIELNEEEN